MLGLKDEGRSAVNEVPKPDTGVSLFKPTARHSRRYLADILIVLAMSALLYYGYLSTGRFASTHTDIARYQCYAEAFWHGTPELRKLPPNQCLFMRADTSSSIVQRVKLHGQLSYIINTVEVHSGTGWHFRSGWRWQQPSYTLSFYDTAPGKLPSPLPSTW